MVENNPSDRGRSLDPTRERRVRSGSASERGGAEAAPGSQSRDGLVISTLFSRESSSGDNLIPVVQQGLQCEDQQDVLSDIRVESRFAFPSENQVAQAAALFGDAKWDGREGPVPMIEVSPGSVRLLAPDLNRRQRSIQEAEVHRRNRVDDLAAEMQRADQIDCLDESQSVSRNTRLDPDRVEKARKILRRFANESSESEETLTDSDSRRGTIAGWFPISRAEIRAKMALRLSEYYSRLSLEESGCEVLIHSRDQVADEDSGSQSVRGAIIGWSRRSRANMVLRLSELDYRPLFEDMTSLPAMVTLTYPGDWESVAPDGRMVKRHLEAFIKRFERAWGQEWSGLWKLEFQERGAPHFHLFMVPPVGYAGQYRQLMHEAELENYRVRKEVLSQFRLPAGRKPYFRKMSNDGLSFEKWLSNTWADIVGAKKGKARDDHIKAGTRVDYNDGLKAADPRRLSVYFSKHGLFKAKDYQNEVPELWQENGGPGRFWGYRGLKPLRRQAVLSPEDHLLLARTLRKLSRIRKHWDPVERRHVYSRMQRYWDEDGECYRLRKVKSNLFSSNGLRLDSARMNCGFLAVNSGPKLAADLARLLEVCGSSRSIRQVRSRKAVPGTPVDTPRCRVCGGRIHPGTGDRHILC